jgi:hypothetical protein
LNEPAQSTSKNGALSTTPYSLFFSFSPFMSTFFGFPGSGYYAFSCKNPTGTKEQWCIVNIDYWIQNGHMQDGHANIAITGMEEVSDHTYEKLPSYQQSDAKQLLTQAGFTIIDNPFTHEVTNV